MTQKQYEECIESITAEFILKLIESEQRKKHAIKLAIWGAIIAFLSTAFAFICYMNP